MTSRPVDEIEEALFAIGGHPLCHELGVELSRTLGGSLVQPVIRAAFLIFGETPEAILSNLDRFFSLPLRGVTFSWRPVLDGVGTIEARFAGPSVPEAAFHVTQGSLYWVFSELLHRKGEVGRARILESDASHTRVEFTVTFDSGAPGAAPPPSR